ncbi:inositol-1(or 4)-monophosphatase [Paenibacillus sabinae T27]|uniref:Inositol-1(Or 4)-monophosphatase n=1 Tax=Paenibacillus sabinae T27 TaxID=1268072 RepID=X4ZD58_9BACL|nr:inositol-1(or 4)-monophosphatase [Paenibacillus sabinae T27]
MKFDLRKLALFAEQAVTKAGDRISELRSREKIEVNYKDSGELVTSADLLSERIIQEAIMGKFQGHRILSEESGVHNWDNFKFAAPAPCWCSALAAGPASAVAFPPAAKPCRSPPPGHLQSKQPLHIRLLLALRAVAPAVGRGAVAVVGLPDLPLADNRLQGQEDEGDVARGHNGMQRQAHPARPQRLIAGTDRLAHLDGGFLVDREQVMAVRAGTGTAAAGLNAEAAGALSCNVQVVPDGIPNELYGEEVVFTTPGIFDDLLTLLRMESE